MIWLRNKDLLEGDLEDYLLEGDLEDYVFLKCNIQSQKEFQIVFENDH